MDFLNESEKVSLKKGPGKPKAMEKYGYECIVHGLTVKITSLETHAFFLPLPLLPPGMIKLSLPV